MGGVQRSKGCSTCRKRKIKCDESQPVCGQCKRADRVCTGPAKSLQFVDEGRKVRTKVGETEEIFQALPSKSMWFSLDKPAENGSLFQKWHRSSICPSTTVVALSETERLRFELVSAFRDGDPGYQFNKLGQRWMDDLPRRLGSTPALDNACACLAAAYASMVRRSDPSTYIDPVRYSKALQSLRTSLQNPKEGFSTHTLAACAILYIIEAIAGSRMTFNVLHHVGGASRILEARGPEAHQNGFAWSVAFHLQGPIIARSIQVGEDCFLNDERWLQLFSEDRADNDIQRLGIRFTREMYSWPSLCKKIRAYRTYNDESLLPDLLSHLCVVRLGLYELSSQIQLILDQSEKVVSGPSFRCDDLVSSVYRFADDLLPRLVAMHAGYTLIVERMITALGMQDLVYGACAPSMIDPAVTAGPGQFDISSLCLRIWMTYEHAWNQRPIGTQFMHVPLTVSYMFAGPTMQAWILKSVNELDEHLRMEKPRIHHITILHIGRIYCGLDTPMAMM